MDSIRDDIIFEARLKQWTDNLLNLIEGEWEHGISYMKKIYEPFDSLPKPSTPKQAGLILGIVDMCLKWVEFAIIKKEEEDGVFNAGTLCCLIANDMKEYIDDETKVNDALTTVLAVRKFCDKRIDSIVFNEDERWCLRENNETGTARIKSDENAKLKLVDIFHTLNIFAKNTFDAIHNAHRVKRLFKI